MTTLPVLLGKLMAALQSHTLCQQAQIVETKEFSPARFFFKVRVRLIHEYKFQVRIYYNQGHIDYAYQLFSNVPLLRWDNKEEFNYLDTYPHHRHDEHGYIKPSPLTGNPLEDIELVFQEVELFLSKSAGNYQD